MIYVVQPMDTVDEIAARTGAAVSALIYDNQLIPPYALAVGQTLYIRSGSAENRLPLVVNGYAYPFISRWVLQQTLPFLSELSVFSYGFTRQGDLVAPPLDDQWMIAQAYAYRARPILTLTPFGPDGRFNNELITAVVQGEEAQNQLLDQLEAVVVEKGFAGVDIDFEYIKVTDRDAFTAFVSHVAERMRAIGCQTSVALAPKTSDDQPGLLYAGKDYQALGAVADHVLLMTYEYGYTYSEPQAIAPLNQIRRVVEYALTRIPAEKIHLGIPNYAYDWPLPYERGVTRARTIGNIEAVRIAIRAGVPIHFDEVAQAPYFTYEAEGIAHEVWFEDLRSMQAKFDLIREYALRGAGYWQIMQLFRANWLLLEQEFLIRKG